LQDTVPGNHLRQYSFLVAGIMLCDIEKNENCPLVGNYAANSGNFLPTFRANLSVSSSRVKNPKITMCVASFLCSKLFPKLELLFHHTILTPIFHSKSSNHKRLHACYAVPFILCSVVILSDIASYRLSLPVSSFTSSTLAHSTANWKAFVR